MRSSRAWLAGISWGAWLVAAAAGLQGATGCGTQPCFRHSDCASSEVCSSGSCVPAPVDIVLPPVDDGGGTDGAITPVVDSSVPVVDTSMPSPDTSDATASPYPDSGDGDTADSATE